MAGSSHVVMQVDVLGYCDPCRYSCVACNRHGILMNDTLPLGQRFSHVYFERGQPMDDSEKMRRRLAALFWDGMEPLRYVASDVLVRELGVKRFLGNLGGWEIFFIKGNIKDVLDSITIIFKLASRNQNRISGVRKWLTEVSRIFQEENVCYRVDDQGGVHLAIDAEFEYNRASTIKGLGSSRYNGVLTHFEKAYAALDIITPDGKQAMNSAFDAVENLFRLMFPKAPSLKATLVKENLEPILQRLYANDKIAIRPATRMLSSISEWVDAIHPYRHAHGEQDPVQPPLSLALLTVSTAASYLRWLAEIDAERQKTP